MFDSVKQLSEEHATHKLPQREGWVRAKIVIKTI